jgi:hypothetical protein
LANFKNSFLIYCTAIKDQNKINLFFKETNHNLLFMYLISIAASQKLKKWEKRLILSFIQKAQNFFFYSLFYKNFKHNTIKYIYINKRMKISY